MILPFLEFHLVTHQTKAYNLLKAVNNWNANPDQRWVFPFGVGGGKVFKIGKLPVNLNAQMYYNAVKPDGVGDWQTRIQLQFLFPKKG